eukprot:768641-Hanusia_phi.AAC.7
MRRVVPQAAMSRLRHGTHETVHADVEGSSHCQVPSLLDPRQPRLVRVEDAAAVRVLAYHREDLSRAELQCQERSRLS